MKLELIEYNVLNVCIMHLKPLGKHEDSLPIPELTVWGGGLATPMYSIFQVLLVDDVI